MQGRPVSWRKIMPQLELILTEDAPAFPAGFEQHAIKLLDSRNSTYVSLELNAADFETMLCAWAEAPFDVEVQLILPGIEEETLAGNIGLNWFLKP